MVQIYIWDFVMHFNLFSDHKQSLCQLYTIIKQENTPLKLKYNGMAKTKIAHCPFIKTVKKGEPK